jgi:Domain of unknown function (DUF4145)
MMEQGFPWTCPFCNRPTTITPSNFKSDGGWFTIENAQGERRIDFQFIVCPNPICKESTLTIFLYAAEEDSKGNYRRKMPPLNTWRLIPPSDAKVFPSYIPKPILDDYREACLIKDSSPRASATLARRCLQGMIRDYWDIRKSRLFDEISAIKDKVDPLTWQAIDAVRSIGNIGAHMEKDINLIIDVDPAEAAQLIWLIERLLYDWYIIRHEREESLKAIAALAEAKKPSKPALPSSTPLEQPLHTREQKAYTGQRKHTPRSHRLAE